MQLPTPKKIILSLMFFTAFSANYCNTSLGQQLVIEPLSKDEISSCVGYGILGSLIAPIIVCKVLGSSEPTTMVITLVSAVMGGLAGNNLAKNAQLDPANKEKELAQLRRDAFLAGLLFELQPTNKQKQNTLPKKPTTEATA